MSGNQKDLVVWQKAMDLVLGIYRITKCFPREETFGLVSQVRRAAVSIPSNIAEGRGRFSSREMSQFLVHARGSRLELETQIEIARALEYIPNEEAEDLTERSGEVGRLLNGMLQHFKQLTAIG